MKISDEQLNRKTRSLDQEIGNYEDSIPFRMNRKLLYAKKKGKICLLF